MKYSITLYDLLQCHDLFFYKLLNFLSLYDIITLSGINKFCNTLSSSNIIWDKFMTAYKRYENQEDYDKCVQINNYETFKLFFTLTAIKNRIQYEHNEVILYNSKCIPNKSRFYGKRHYIKNLKGIGRLIYLEKLYIDENELFYMPKEIGNLVNLVKLDLSSNHLSMLPEELEI